MRVITPPHPTAESGMQDSKDREGWGAAGESSCRLGAHYPDHSIHPSTRAELSGPVHLMSPEQALPSESQAPNPSFGDPRKGLLYH